MRVAKLTSVGQLDAQLAGCSLLLAGVSFMLVPIHLLLLAVAVEQPKFVRSLLSHVAFRTIRVARTRKSE